ncbi:hypothetical protein CPB84DRAFT_1845580 [Gymnopilus junonius]|uniref:Uncharacterized protein n=1 Tax=Gymnopilus junonius TaxID=109634 RepID=A0A9P5NRD6_GYMJU|nr:hypothetical protein CPB84DRAFT_1845580 [Gymnopilus junonius]
MQPPPPPAHPTPPRLALLRRQQPARHNASDPQCPAHDEPAQQSRADAGEQYIQQQQLAAQSAAAAAGAGASGSGGTAAGSAAGTGPSGSAYNPQLLEQQIRLSQLQQLQQLQNRYSNSSGQSPGILPTTPLLDPSRQGSASGDQYSGLPTPAPSGEIRPQRPPLDFLSPANFTMDPLPHALMPSPSPSTPSQNPIRIRSTPKSDVLFLVDPDAADSESESDAGLLAYAGWQCKYQWR